MARKQATFRLDEDFMTTFRRYCKAKQIQKPGITQAKIIENAISELIATEVKNDPFVAKIMENNQW